MLALVVVSMLIPQAWSADLKTTEDLQDFDKSFSLYEKQVRYNIPYSISNGMINNMTLFCEHGSLLIDVSSQSKLDISLEIELPRNMLDPKTNDKDSRFFVLRDGEEINYEEIPYRDYRKLSMSFPHNTNEIEIIHAFVLALKPPMCKVTDNPPYSLILPPLKQFKSGVPVDEIQCKEGFLKVIKKSNGNPACVKPETKSELVQRNWIQLQFSFCGADGFDSKDNQNKSNSTHFWDENYCKWWPAGYDPSLHQEERKQLQMKKILDHCNRVSLGLETDQPYLQYENETHIITSDTCE